MKQLRLEALSSTYSAKKLQIDDINLIYTLCKDNPRYYKYMETEVSPESIHNDLMALPPNKQFCDKFFLGFFEKEKLIAVMDLILEYPNRQTCFIGFFMVSRELQGKGVGTAIIREISAYLGRLGYGALQLAYVEGNQPAQAFWSKNGFTHTGTKKKQKTYTTVVMRRALA